MLFQKLDFLEYFFIGPPIPPQIKGYSLQLVMHHFFIRTTLGGGGGGGGDLWFLF